MSKILKTDIHISPINLQSFCYRFRIIEKKNELHTGLMSQIHFTEIIQSFIIQLKRRETRELRKTVSMIAAIVWNYQ